MRETRDLTDGSVENAIGHTLCANGVDQKVYHGGQWLVSPQITKLLAKRVKIMSWLETKFLHVQDADLAKDPKTDVASIQEIREEMVFFGHILHCHDCVFSLPWQTRTIFLLRKEQSCRSQWES
jgi:hypothetical protein